MDGHKSIATEPYGPTAEDFKEYVEVGVINLLTGVGDNLSW